MACSHSHLKNTTAGKGSLTDFLHTEMHPFQFTRTIAINGIACFSNLSIQPNPVFVTFSNRIAVILSNEEVWNTSFDIESPKAGFAFRTLTMFQQRLLAYWATENIGKYWHFCSVLECRQVVVFVRDFRDGVLGNSALLAAYDRRCRRGRSCVWVVETMEGCVNDGI